MKIQEIKGGIITLVMEPEDAMDIAVACHAAELAARAAFPSYELTHTQLAAHEKQFIACRALFEALAVAGHSHYCIGDGKELDGASLSALRAGKR